MICGMRESGTTKPSSSSESEKIVDGACTECAADRGIPGDGPSGSMLSAKT